MYCINQYDIRMTKEPSPACGMTWPHELDDVTKYLTVSIRGSRCYTTNTAEILTT